MPDRGKVIKALDNCANLPQCRDCPWEECDLFHETISMPYNLARDALALLKEQEAMPSYNDAVDTIKFQSKVMSLACETLAKYELEEPCNALFYIKEQRQKCEEQCCSHKIPDEWCWRRYLTLMAMEDSDD